MSHQNPLRASRAAALVALAWYALATSGAAPLGLALLWELGGSAEGEEVIRSCPAGDACCCAPEAHVRGGCPCGDAAGKAGTPAQRSRGERVFEALRCSGWPLEGGLVHCAKVPPHLLERVATLIFSPPAARSTLSSGLSLKTRATEPPEKVPRAGAGALA